MLFNSFQFLLFFPIVTMLFFLLPHRFRWLLLLAASCGFYMAFIPIYILILFLLIIIDYVAGLLIEKATGFRRRLFLVVSILSNCGVLGFFKYYNFLAGNVGALSSLLGMPLTLPLQHCILPIGLSFHTFQAMSYTIEVYRGRVPAERHFGIYALYVMFYPQLVAGPIERPQNLIPQFYQVHHFDYNRAVQGLRIMLWGMFKKVVVADNLSIAVNAVYSHPHQYSGVALIVATVFFSFQIFCDFSGYSDIAIGAAQVMGFKIMTNFNRPYYAKSISEFWRRWHISLSTWFRDYLYIPLGGNRVPLGRVYFNLFVVFLVSGLWHGANWTFVIWGGLHGTYFLSGLVTRKLREQWLGRFGLEGRSWVKALDVAGIFALVSFAWIFFRAASLTDAAYIVGHLGTGWDSLRSVIASARSALAVSPFESIVGMVGVLLMEMVHFVQRKQSLMDLFVRLPTWERWAIYGAVVLIILLFGNLGSNQFIYFQF